LSKQIFEALYKRRLQLIERLVLSFHCVVDRMPHYNVSEDDVLEIFKRGRLYLSKCELPDKIGLHLYDGKKRKTSVLIVAIRSNYAKVVTLWVQKGRV